MQRGIVDYLIDEMRGRGVMMTRRKPLMAKQSQRTNLIT